ncbi:uncharacterized protein MONOS_10725 [Monocercomonoides exilis]|uniref:uncharacterized protein n=1 Tax=Monocercomonoides exilis TaxID=2049356 RepID=UPI00355A11CB|nr:hypothetical protein MONOS_10725 [Monocercomonoides exilis]|eukprot:MONOS_10725.1-p1 / transcript=MONOS_10725.1 / gene=MONOS_10725 / organism=Monocercomonoides_exilis_PA203 / gene_product=unspecified product / transcript_product=unspecified product / location=Mono_scaffold00498:24778-28063(-) / protein_length=994 / sequence_SO=supercontig / SO=protein_coding / is_pseudo=false
MSILDKSSHHVPAKQLSSRNDKNVSFKKSSEPQSRIIQEKSYLESDFLTGGTASFAFPSDFGLQTPAISSFASPSKSVVPLTEYHEKIRRKQIQQPIISRDSPHPKADVINTRVVSPLSSLEKRNKKEIPVSFTPSHLPPSPLKSIAPPRKFAPDFGNPQFAVEKTTDISDSFLNPEKIAPLRTNQKKLHFETDASLFQDSFHSILPNPISASSLLLDKPFFDSQETNDSMKVPSTISHPISSKSTKDFSGPSILPIQQSSQQPLSKDSIESKSSDMSTFSFLPSDVQLHFSKSNNPSKRLPLSNDTNASRYSFNETRLTSSPVYPSSMISSFPTESHPSISYSTGSELFSTTTVPSSSSFHTTLFSHNTPSSTSEDLKAFHMMAKIFRFWRAEATKSAKRKRAINRRLAKEQKADNFFLRKTGRRLLKHWLFEAVPASQKENEKLLMEADRFREDVLLAKGLRALAINKDLLQRKKKAEKLALSFFTNKRQAFYFHIWKNWAKEKKPALPLTPMQIISLFMLMGLPVEQILRVCVECFADIVQINEEIQKKEDNEEEVDSSSFSYLLPIMNKLPERAIAYPFLKKSYDFSSVHSCFFNCHNSSEKSTQTSLSLAQATPYDKNTSGSSFQFKVARQEQSLQLFFSSQDETTNFDNSASMLDQSKQNCPEVIDIVSRLSTHLTQPLYFCIEANRSRAIRTRDQSPFIFCIRKSKVLPPFHLLSVSTSSPSPSSFSSASSLALLSIEAQNRIPISFSLLPQRICPSSSLHRFLISLKILSSSLLRPVFNHWRRIAHKRALFKERHLLRMKKMMFTQWNEAYVQDYCYQKREIRQRAELVRRMCSNKVKRAAFGEWLAATEKRMDLKNRRMQLEKDLLLNRMKSQLYEWNILAWERKEENKNTQKALALYSATISRKILWEWNLIAREQQDLRELLQNVREQRESKERTTLMRVAWDVWIESMEKLSEEKEKALTCIEHWAMIHACLTPGGIIMPR